jgi:hypothetical protein
LRRGDRRAVRPSRLEDRRHKSRALEGN